MIALQSVLERALYAAMVNYFVPESDKIKFLERQDENQALDQVNQNITEQDLLHLSILSKVSLKWTVTNFTTDGDPYHILQAGGTLGFTRYDYALLHPETILPLQAKVMAGETTKPISLPHIQMALQQKNFYFQVLQFIPIEADDEDSPTLMEPTTPESDDDGIFTSITDPNDDVAPNTHVGDQNEGDDGDDDDAEADPFNESVGDDTLGTALIVVCSVSAFAFVIFLRFVVIKSKQIQTDRMLRKQSLAKKKKKKDVQDADSDAGKSKEDDDKATSISTTLSPITDESTASRTPTPVSSPTDTVSLSSFSMDSSPPRIANEAPKDVESAKDVVEEEDYNDVIYSGSAVSV